MTRRGERSKRRTRTSQHQLQPIQKTRATKPLTTRPALSTPSARRRRRPPLQTHGIRRFCQTHLLRTLYDWTCPNAHPSLASLCMRSRYAVYLYSRRLQTHHRRRHCRHSHRRRHLPIHTHRRGGGLCQSHRPLRLRLRRHSLANAVTSTAMRHQANPISRIRCTSTSPMHRHHHQSPDRLPTRHRHRQARHHQSTTRSLYHRHLHSRRPLLWTSSLVSHQRRGAAARGD